MHVYGIYTQVTFAEKQENIVTQNGGEGIERETEREVERETEIDTETDRETHTPRHMLTER